MQRKTVGSRATSAQKMLSVITALALVSTALPTQAFAVTPSSSERPGFSVLTDKQFDSLSQAQNVNIPAADLDNDVLTVDYTKNLISVEEQAAEEASENANENDDDSSMFSDQSDEATNDEEPSEVQDKIDYSYLLGQAPELTPTELGALTLTTNADDLSSAFSQKQEETQEAKLSAPVQLPSGMARFFADVRTAIPFFSASAGENISAGNTKIESLTANWITQDIPSTPLDIDPDLLHQSYADDTQKQVRFEVNFALSGERNYEIGEVSLTLPKTVIAYRGSDKPNAGKMSLSVPMTPDSKALFAYSEIGDNYVLTNTRRLSAATSAHFEFSLKDITPHSLIGDPDSYTTDPLIASLTVAGENDQNVTADSNALYAQFDTSETASYVTSRHEVLAEEYPASFPSELRPQNADDYIYLSFYTYGVPRGNQSYTGSFTQFLGECPEGTFILGTRYNGKVLAPDESGNVTYSIDNGNTIFTTSSRSMGYSTTYVACPKSSVPDGGHYKFNHNVSFTLTSSDDKQVTTVTGNAMKEYSPIAFSAPHGHFAIRKHGGSYYGYALNKLRAENTAQAKFTVENIAFGFPWTRDEAASTGSFLSDYGKVPYTTVSDDFSVTFDHEAEELDATDFEISSISFPKMTAYDYKRASASTSGYYEGRDGVLGGTVSGGSWGYIPTPANLDVAVFAKIGGDANAWTKMATARWIGGALASIDCENGATSALPSKTITFPANVTDYRTKVTTTTAGYIYETSPVITVKGTSANIKRHVEELFENSDTPSTIVENTAVIEAYDHNDTKLMDMTWSTQDTFAGASLFASPSKKMTYKNDTSNRRIVIDNRLSVAEQSNLTDKSEYNTAIEEGYILKDMRGTFYDLLPKGVVVDMDSVSLRAQDMITYKAIEKNWRGSGRDMLIVKADLAPNPFYSGNSIAGKYGMRDEPSLRFTSYMSWENMRDFGADIENVFAYESSNKTLGTVKGYMGEPDDPAFGNNHTSKDATKNVYDYMKGLSNGSRGTDNAFVYGRDADTIQADVSSLASLRKDVSAGDGLWGEGYASDNLAASEASAVNVYENQQYQYRLRMENDKSTQAKDIVLYDKLEGYVPTGEGENTDLDAGDVQWRGTFVDIDTSQIASLGADPVIYYSTKADIVLDGKDGGDRPDTDITDADIWSRVRPTDPSQITAVAVDARKTAEGDDFVLDYGKAVAAYITMKAPKAADITLPDGIDDPSLAYDSDLTSTSGEAAEQAEAGIAGGAHAYNSASMYLTTIKDGKQSERQLIRKDYTKVGLVPFTIKVEKSFDDDNNRDGKRPESVTMHLLANGVRVDGEASSFVLSNENKWTQEFTGFPKYDGNGREVVYSLEEDAASGYELSYSVDTTGSTLIMKAVNRHEPEKVRISGQKNWTGEESSESRPNSVDVDIYADGKFLKTVKATEANQWQYSLSVPRYRDGGIEIEYSVQEKYVKEYESTVETTRAEHAPDADGVSVDILANITNAYHPYGDLKISKKIVNATQASKDAVFEIELNVMREDGEPDSGSYNWTSNDGRSGTFTNGDVLEISGGQEITVKDLPSESTYSITEHAAQGWTCTSYDSNVEGAAVTGAVQAAKTSAVELENVYSSAGAYALQVEKTLQHHVLLPRMFKFELLDQDKTTVLFTGSNGGADGSSVALPTQRFTEQDDGKTFTRFVRELDGGRAGYVCDNSVWRAEMTPHDNGDGTMSVEAKYYKEGSEGESAAQDKIVFENLYKASGQVELKAWKTLKGANLKDKEFELVLYEVAGEEEKEVSRAYNSADGTILFDPIAYNETDIGSTHCYKAKEVVGTRDDVTYSNSVFTYTVEVVDSGNGILSFNTNVDQNPVFINEMKPGNLIVNKFVPEGADQATEHNFKIQFAGTDLPDGEWYFERAEAEKEKFAFAVYSEADKGLRFYKRTEDDFPVQGQEYHGHIADDIYWDIENMDTSTFDESMPNPWSRQYDTYDSVVVGSVIEYVEIVDKIKPRSIDSWFGGMTLKSTIVEDGIDKIGIIGLDKIDTSTMVLLGRPFKRYDFYIMGGSESSYSNVETLQGIEYWDTSNITSFRQAFEDMPYIKSIDLNNWDTSHVTDFSRMFYCCTSLSQINMENVDVGAVTDMSEMFSGTNLTTLELHSWHSDTTLGMNSMFSGCHNLISIDLSGCQISNVASMYGMFSWCSSLTTINLTGINTNNVTTMMMMFYECSNLQVLDLDSLDTANVTNMNCMFAGCSKLTELDLKSFNTHKVTNMSNMFADCGNLCSIDLTSFDTSNVTCMEAIFENCKSLSSVDLSSFDTQNVTDMSKMFANCTKLTVLDVNSFDVSNVTAINQMFSGCSSLTSLNLANWDTSKILYMSYMFSNCTALLELDVRGWALKNVSSLFGIFSGCSNLITVNMDGWDTGKVTSFEKMFQGCSKLTTIDMNNFDTSHVNNMAEMFSDCTSLEVINKEGWNTSNVVYMNKMFSGCSSLISVDLSTLDMTNVINVSSMFAGCTALTSFKSFGSNAHKIETMEKMFFGCNNLITVNLDNFDTSNTTNMMKLFADCANLTVLDVSNLNVNKNTHIQSMFSGCTKLTTIYSSSSWETEISWFTAAVFSSCVSLIGGHGTRYDPLGTNDGTYARIDDPDNGKPGYFTYKDPVTSTSSATSATTYSIAPNTDLFTMGIPYEALLTAPTNNIGDGNSDGGDSNGLFDLPVASAAEAATNQATIDVQETISPAKHIYPELAPPDENEPAYAWYGTIAEADESVLPNGYAVGDAVVVIDNEIERKPKGVEGEILSVMVPSLTEDGRDDCWNMETGTYEEDMLIETKINWVKTYNQKLDGTSNHPWNDSENDAKELRHIVFANDVRVVQPTGSCNDYFSASGSKYYQRLRALKNISGLWKLDTSKITSMGWMRQSDYTAPDHGMFMDCNNLLSLDLNNFNTANVTNMTAMFYGCRHLTNLDVSGWDTSNVRGMRSMFSNCSSLTSLDVSGRNTGNVTNMSNMFYSCSSLASLDVSGFDTGNVTSMSYMFEGCSSLTSLDVSGWNTSNVTNMYWMFKNCSSLTSLDVSGWNTGNVTQMKDMFHNCDCLSFLAIGSKFKTSTNVYFPSPNRLYVSYPVTGKWVSYNAQQGGPYSPAELRQALIDAGTDTSLLAGTWQWEEDKQEYYIAYDLNGAVGTMAKTSHPLGSTVILPTPSAYYFNHTFREWNTSPDGSGTSYQANQEITQDLTTSMNTITLYAIWDELDNKATLKDNTLSFTLHGNESATFSNIPAGTTYTVWEETPAGWVCVKQKGKSGTIAPLETQKASFTNEYQPTKAQATITGSKLLDGSPVKDYRFSIYEVSSSSAPVADDATPIAEETSAISGIFAHTFEYTPDNIGTHYYAIKEVIDPARTSEISYDTSTQYAQVEVRDTGEGILTTEVTYPNGDIVFNNATQPGKLSITKNILNKDTVPTSVLDSLSFTARVTVTDPSTREEKETTINVPANGTPAEIDNVAAGSIYEIEEINIPDGYAFVSDKSQNLTGVIQAGKTATATLTNAYSSRGETTIEIDKNLIGGKLLGNDFFFALAKTGSADELDAVANDDTGHATFFVSADASAIDFATEQEYTILEKSITDDRWKDIVDMDGAPKTVTVKWSDNGHGRLIGSVEYPAQGTQNAGGEDVEPVQSVIFNNSVRNGNLSVTKHVKNKTEAIEDKTYEFTTSFTTATGETIEPISWTIENSNTANDESVYSNNKLYLKDGQTCAFTLPHGAIYKIDENAPAGFDVASNNDSGTIEANKTAACEFTNTYSAYGTWTINAMKRTEGFDLVGEDFTFIAVPAEKQTVPDSSDQTVRSSNENVPTKDIFVEQDDGANVTATNDRNGNIIFDMGDITLDDIGRTTIYRISEIKTEPAKENVQYDNNIYYASATLVDDGQGGLSANITYMDKNGKALESAPVFVNKYVSPVVLPYTGEYMILLMLVGLVLIFGGILQKTTKTQQK